MGTRFLIESKSYMNHPDYWPEWREQLYFSDGTPDPRYPGWTTADKRRAALEFWCKFPRAWCKFHYGTIRDFIRYKIWWKIRSPRIGDY